MAEFNILSLEDVLDSCGESVAQTLLSAFYCPINPDIENYLKNRAVDNIKKHLSPTFLIYSDDLDLMGYFTLSLKTIDIKRASLSRRMRDRVTRYCHADENADEYNLPCILIAQLGKNYGYNDGKSIDGSEIMDMAIEKIQTAQSIVGGRIIYIECEDKPKLIDFYEKNGFVKFDHRKLDSDESGLNGEYLIRMLRYL